MTLWPIDILVICWVNQTRYTLEKCVYLFREVRIERSENSKWGERRIYIHNQIRVG